MFDKDLTIKVCNLTCTKEDVCVDQTKIKYDYNYPFKKYYNVNIIIGAIKKYLSKEWDADILAGWACIYNWIICGGFHDNLKEKLNSFEEFFKNVISWDLDGMSFFDENHLDADANFDEWIQQYNDWDHIWQTRDGWEASYAMIGPNAEFNEDQFVVVYNDELKEYMIIHSNYLENGFEDDKFKYITEADFIDLIKNLKEKDFNILCCSEKWYYSELFDEE